MERDEQFEEWVRSIVNPEFHDFYRNMPEFVRPGTVLHAPHALVLPLGESAHRPWVPILVCTEGMCGHLNNARTLRAYYEEAGVQLEILERRVEDHEGWSDPADYHISTMTRLRLYDHRGMVETAARLRMWFAEYMRKIKNGA